jgi:hypothetical protein
MQVSYDPFEDCGIPDYENFTCLSLVHVTDEDTASTLPTFVLGDPDIGSAGLCSVLRAVYCLTQA